MSSIMRARNALPGRGEEAEVIGGPLRAEGCWTFNARDQMPRSSPLTAHPLTATAKNAPASTPPSRESGFVPCAGFRTPVVTSPRRARAAAVKSARHEIGHQAAAVIRPYRQETALRADHFSLQAAGSRAAIIPMI